MNRPESIHTLAAQEAGSVSPYLLMPPIDCPAFVRGQKVPVPGEFGHRVVIDMKWGGRFWDYSFDTDLADAVEITAPEATRREAA